ncbi:LytTR family DNA-binding domain-containing protein [Marinicella sp. W31]|uniref:LytTR family DNA-binding domain-containing protein n=1 Tax=Marinicella sp. W31 TaxID=3023713 RepID=UPI00375679F6
MQDQFRLGDISPLKYFFAITIVLGVVFGLIKADDDSELSVAFNIFQWVIQTTVPIAILLTIHLALQSWQSFNRLNPWLKLTLSGVLGGLIFTPLALMLDVYLLGEGWPSTRPAFWLQMADEASGVVPPVVIVWLAMNAPWVLRYELRKQDDPQKSTSEQTNNWVQPAFLKLIKQPIALDDIRVIKAELHYLEIISDDHRELILYNLKDAIAELPAELGMQCHRSYWVARKAISQFKKKGREGVLLLKNEIQVPVSRSHTASFKKLTI